MTILVADDEAMVRDLAVAMLERAGYRVIAARDGAEAAAIARDRAVDLHAVLLDVDMPGQSGREVYETLRTERPHVPVVFCTGHGAAELEELERLTGRPGLSKPYRRAELIAAIESALGTPRGKPTN